MWAALLRMLKLTGLGVLLCGFILGTLRIYGRLNQSADFKSSAFFNRGFAIVAHRGGGADFPENTSYAIKETLKLVPSAVIFVDVRVTKDGVLVAFFDENLQSTTEGNGSIHKRSYAEIQKLDAGNHFRIAGKKLNEHLVLPIPTIQSLLEDFPDTKFILNVMSYTQGIDEQLISVIENVKSENRVLIQSPYDSVLVHMRKLRPEWKTGTSPAEILKTNILSGMYLETLAPMKGQVFLPVINSLGNEYADDRVVREIHRHGKKIIFWDSDQITLSDLVRRGADGILTDRPTQLSQRLLSLPNGISL